MRDKPFAIGGDDEVGEAHLVGGYDSAIAARGQPGEVVLSPEDERVHPLAFEEVADALLLEPNVGQHFLGSADRLRPILLGQGKYRGNAG